MAVSESDPNVIYVGMGEACVRGNIVVRRRRLQIHRWRQNLEAHRPRDTHAIGRLIVNPNNPDIVFVAALGHLFGRQRRARRLPHHDGGKTWQKVLYRDAKTGAIDLALTPPTPTSSMPRSGRSAAIPGASTAAAPAAGCFNPPTAATPGRTHKARPARRRPRPHRRHRFGANPERVWAIVEAEEGGVYRSDDGGDNWQLMTDDHRFRQRAWYYSHIFADPKCADTVYVLNTAVDRSNDGGKTFAGIARAARRQSRSLDRARPIRNRMINSNDGGATISTNGGDTWTQRGQPAHRAVLSRRPRQRFPTTSTARSRITPPSPSPARSPTAPSTNATGTTSAAARAARSRPIPTIRKIVYAGSYDGDYALRSPHRTKQQAINPWPVNPIGWARGGRQTSLPVDRSHRLFAARSQHAVLRRRSACSRPPTAECSWTIISPDLTRNDKSKQAPSGGPITKDNTGVEYYDTIFTVAESPVQKDLIWAGTDDGLVHVTRDGGQHWENVTPKAMPDWSTVSMIEASPHDAGTAYVAVERHKLRRLRALRLQDHRLRQDLDQAHQRPARERLRARRARRSEPSRPAVRRNRAGRLRLV